MVIAREKLLALAGILTISIFVYLFHGKKTAYPDRTELLSTTLLLLSTCTAAYPGHSEQQVRVADAVTAIDS